MRDSIHLRFGGIHEREDNVNVPKGRNGYPCALEEWKQGFQIFCERFGHPKKIYSSNRKLCRDCRKEESTIMRGTFASTERTPQDRKQESVEYIQ